MKNFQPFLEDGFTFVGMTTILNIHRVKRLPVLNPLPSYNFEFPQALGNMNREWYLTSPSVYLRQFFLDKKAQPNESTCIR